MDKVKFGHFYILGIGDDKRFWAVPLHMAGSENMVILQYDEDSGRWKETVWHSNIFTFVVEVEKIGNTVPVDSMELNAKKKVIKAVLER